METNSLKIVSKSLSLNVRHVSDAGKKWVQRDILMWTLLTSQDRSSPRLGLMVSRRLGGAVQRNRIKRLVREVFRVNKASLNKGVDLVVYPRPGCDWKNFWQAEQTLLNLWKRAGIFQSAST